MVNRNRIGFEVLWQSGAILLIALILGLIINYLRPDSLEIFEDWYPKTQMIQHPKKNLTISFDEAKKLFFSRKAIFLDARSPELYQWGHIPGARNLPLDTFDEHFHKLMAHIPRDTMIITYCDGNGCGLSNELAILLIDNGYTNVRVLTNGWSLWEAHNLPIETGERSGG